ncbi:glycosyltransferase family 2 protein [uncultured Ilyobacter sp.]|uniref:glycosyltransferase family 2 protein n=1 Tax=uncultured Ilyobacter sp. TaxID=544433 RepID=UPI0029C080CF|nr:glycosyltransferase family 2 protein [uncultured Ilyobacter sp.]
MKNNIVSIITPLYNSENFIKKTLESVKAQTYENWEMIIVDDVSTDNGVKIVKKYAKQDSRIKLIQLDKNSGGAVARNIAIEAARGKYIAFLDSDDLWHPEKLEKQISFMQENAYSFTFTKYRQMSENGDLLNKYIEVPKKVSYRQFLLKNPIGCLTAIYDSNKLGKIYMPNIRKRQDYALWLKILKQEKNGYGLNENLAYYRLRQSSVSSNKRSLIKYQWKLYREIEKLNLLESIFYMGCVISQKIFGIK